LCRVLCEDYAQRGSGVPDLFIWNYTEKHCKFVEVKGPGDRLQENQKVRISLGCQAECTIFKYVYQLWIDVMQRAEVNVEVCHVEEQGKSTTKRQGKGKKRSKKTRKKPKLVDSDVETTETLISGWEGSSEDELNASQYLQGDDQGSTLVRKRSVEDTERGTELGNKPAAKRPRTSMREAD
jgi:Fanconi-associated nuclease 1